MNTKTAGRVKAERAPTRAQSISTAPPLPDRRQRRVVADLSWLDSSVDEKRLARAREILAHLEALA